MVMPDHSGRRVGGFELIEPLASGGFATVYRARQVRLDRDVAVKVLDPALARDPDIAARFEREGRAAASLDHPNVVPVYEAGEDDGLVYLAMRLVPGETLDDLLLRGGPLTTARTLHYVEPVAAALDHAHQRDLIHRDVKPSNIFIEGERVWLGDFGIAATADQVGHYTTGALGTAHYMAPEQASRGELDGRADLYALGCVVHRCLTGRPPYDSGELVATLVAHVNEPIPETGNPTLDRFLATALAKDPEARFARGADLVDSLRWIASLGSLEAPAGRGGSDRAPPTQARAGAVAPPAPPSPPPPASTAGSGGIAAAEGTTGSPGVTDRGEFPPPLASPSPSPSPSPPSARRTGNVRTAGRGWSASSPRSRSWWAHGWSSVAAMRVGTEPRSAPRSLWATVRWPWMPAGRCSPPMSRARPPARCRPMVGPCQQPTSRPGRATSPCPAGRRGSRRSTRAVR
jgi:serine/threonine-protein kinase